MSLTISLPPDLERRLQDQAQAEGIPIEELVRRALEIRWATAPAATEATLLEKINEGFPEAFWERYRALRAKLQDGTIFEEERQAFLTMVDQVERRQATRLRYLSDLASLRGVRLQEVIQALGLSSEP